MGVELELKSHEHTALSALMSSRTGYDLFATNSASNNPLGIIGSLASTDESNPWNNAQLRQPQARRADRQGAGDRGRGRARRHPQGDGAAGDGRGGYIPIGASGRFVYWWPWVKNYYGEAMSGGTSVGPYMEHLWLDQALKAEMQ